MAESTNENVKLEKERVLALEVRPSKLGFAVFDGPAQLVDWGIKACGGRNRRDAATVIENLLRMYAPSFVVIRRRTTVPRKSSGAVAAAITDIRLSARRRWARLRFITAAQVRRF